MLSISLACALARSAAKFSIGLACQLLLRAGLTLNQASRYVLGYLRSQRKGTACLA